MKAIRVLRLAIAQCQNGNPTPPLEVFDLATGEKRSAWEIEGNGPFRVRFDDEGRGPFRPLQVHCWIETDGEVIERGRTDSPATG